jgi:hypothetical protein
MIRRFLSLAPDAKPQERPALFGVEYPSPIASKPCEQK